MSRVTGPRDLKMPMGYDDIVSQLEARFNASDFLVEGGIVRIIINGNFSAEDRQKVAVDYRNAGWDIVAHLSSLENGQAPGVTMFTFIKST